MNRKDFSRPDEFEYDVRKTCCFSGHRPESLPGNGDLNDPALRKILSVLRLAIEETINEGYDTFLCGMARGIDIWAARFIMEIRLKRPDINLVCVLPYKEQSRSFTGLEKYDYNMTLAAAHQVICLSDRYEKNCMRQRNEYMVAHSSKLIAVVNNYRSGTGMTINIARKKGIDVRIIDVEKNKALFTD